MADQPSFTYKSLDDIRARKEALRKELQQDNSSMKTQWNTLFHKKEKSNLPAHRFANIMASSVTLFDGLIFAWKLYNRFGGGKNRKAKKKSKGILASLFS